MLRHLGSKDGPELIFLPTTDDFPDYYTLGSPSKERSETKVPRVRSSTISRQEADELLRRRILIPVSDEDGLRYVRLSTRWRRKFRSERQDQDLAMAALRISMILCRHLPYPYTHPLQISIALNCKELLATTILPYINCDVSKAFQQAPFDEYKGISSVVIYLCGD
ncbi:hypothetical protein ACJZ2D_012597 [Fusarium nematophilum]